MSEWKLCSGACSYLLEGRRTRYSSMAISHDLKHLNIPAFPWQS